MDPGKVRVISTGSQGEPMSALSLMAAGESKWLHLRPNDVVVISAHPIPGNEWAVGRVIDGLYRRGAEVIHTGVEPVHVSGHARQGELEVLLSVARPEWFIPVHGEYRHLVNHAQLATRMGVADDKALLCEDGDSVVIDDAGIHRGDRSRPGSSTSTAPSGTSATVCCATAASWPRRAWWWWSPPSTPTPGEVVSRARDRDPGLDPCARGRSPARRGQ